MESSRFLREHDERKSRGDKKKKKLRDRIVAPILT